MAAELVKDAVGEQGFMTIDEAAAYLCLCRSKIYQLMNEGELPYGLVGKRRRISSQMMVSCSSARRTLAPLTASAVVTCSAMSWR